MHKTNSIYFSIGDRISSLLMILLLLWLTVSTPFVYAQQLEQQKSQQYGSAAANEDYNPFSSTTEEKSETGVNTLSEYLHELPQVDSHFTVLVKYYKAYPSDLYFSHHPELLSPPPEA